jgi:uncharacterized protein (DUF2147 family)
MKKIIALSALFFFAISMYAQDSEKIKGYWMTEKGTSQIQIYKAKNTKYYGKLCWLDEPNEFGAPKKDKENPDAKLKERPLLDLLLLQSFEYDNSEKNWSEGTIYDPESGKTYDCYMWFENGNYDELKIKGFVLGMRFLGRETTWKRAAAKK